MCVQWGSHQISPTSLKPIRRICYSNNNVVRFFGICTFQFRTAKWNETMPTRGANNLVLYWQLIYWFLGLVQSNQVLPLKNPSNRSWEVFDTRRHDIRARQPTLWHNSNRHAFCGDRFCAEFTHLKQACCVWLNPVTIMKLCVYDIIKRKWHHRRLLNNVSRQASYHFI